MRCEERAGNTHVVRFSIWVHRDHCSNGILFARCFYGPADRILVYDWMVSIFDAVVLDWWMFTKTDIFGILIKKKTGRMPDVMRVDPQWDGKEFLKLFLEVIISVVLAWIFIKVR